MLLPMLLVSAAKQATADITSNATRDAKNLVICMKALDAANDLTYTKLFE